MGLVFFGMNEGCGFGLAGLCLGWIPNRFRKRCARKDLRDMSKLMQETLHNSKSNTQRLRNYSTYTTEIRRARVPQSHVL